MSDKTIGITGADFAVSTSYVEGGLRYTVRFSGVEKVFDSVEFREFFEATNTVHNFHYCDEF